MDKLQKYVNQALGIELKYFTLPKNELNKLPLYLRGNNLKTGVIFERQIIFITINNEVDFTTGQFRKQADIIENTLGKPVVFVFENIKAYNRIRLIQKKVAFILPGKQMYLPFMFIDLKEFKQVHYKKVEKLFPAAQCLLFYYLRRKDVTGINFKTLAGNLRYGQMTITRAANTLKELGLCEIAGGKDKHLLFKIEKTRLWNEVQPYLISPIRKIVFANPLKNIGQIFITGLSALAHYTNIADDGIKSYAVSFNTFKVLRNEKTVHLADGKEESITLQIWKYNPGILANNRYVDPLSLYLTFKDSNDERVEGELNKLIGNLW